MYSNPFYSKEVCISTQVSLEWYAIAAYLSLHGPRKKRTILSKMFVILSLSTFPQIVNKMHPIIKCPPDNPLSISP